MPEVEASAALSPRPSSCSADVEAMVRLIVLPGRDHSALGEEDATACSTATGELVATDELAAETDDSGLLLIDWEVGAGLIRAM